MPELNDALTAKNDSDGAHSKEIIASEANVPEVDGGATANCNNSTNSNEILTSEVSDLEANGVATAN